MNARTTERTRREPGGGAALSVIRILTVRCGGPLVGPDATLAGVAIVDRFRRHSLQWLLARATTPNRAPQGASHDGPKPGALSTVAHSLGPALGTQCQAQLCFEQVGPRPAQCPRSATVHFLGRPVCSLHQAAASNPEREEVLTFIDRERS